jgi:hypothetical protein
VIGIVLLGHLVPIPTALAISELAANKRVEGGGEYFINSRDSFRRDKLIRNYTGKDTHVYVDTMISPSYTSAVAQVIQLPGISGMENNMVIFAFDRNEDKIMKEID